MKKLVSASLLTIATTLLSFNVTSTAWKLNANNYAVKFSGKRVDGTFKGLKTDIIFDGNNLPSSHINASIDANTVNTGNSLKSKHARQVLMPKNILQFTLFLPALPKKAMDMKHKVSSLSKMLPNKSACHSHSPLLAIQVFLQAPSPLKLKTIILTKWALLTKLQFRLMYQLINSNMLQA